MKRSRPTAHPQRVALHNEIHARPPEAMSAPLAISHMVMVGDAPGARGQPRPRGRAAARPPPAAARRAIQPHPHGPGSVSHALGTAHRVRDLDLLAADRSRWFRRARARHGHATPCRTSGWRSCRASAWPACTCGCCRPQALRQRSLVKHVLNEDTLVASTVADGHGEVYTDFALHADGFSRMVLLAGERHAAPARPPGPAAAGDRHLPHGGPAGPAGGARGRHRCWRMPSANWPNWRRPSAWPAATRSRSCWTG